MRRLRKLGWIAIMGLLMCPSVFAQDQKSERDAVVKSFKQYIKDYIDSYKTDKRQKIFYREPNPQLGLKGGWGKVFFEPQSGYGIDVKVTDSLVSPYSGVCEFTMTVHSIALQDTKEQAEKETNFNVTTVKHKHTYAYQEGHWTPVGRQYHSDYPDKWYDCDSCNVYTHEHLEELYGCWEPDAKHPVTECRVEVE
jgi:hypothetical protein